MRKHKPKKHKNSTRLDRRTEPIGQISQEASQSSGESTSASALISEQTELKRFLSNLRPLQLGLEVVP